MKRNLGNADRVVRVILGLFLLSLLIGLHTSAKYFGLIGLIPLVTAIVGYCPLYSLIGIKTLR